jgi:hypothetical protein
LCTSGEKKELPCRSEASGWTAVSACARGLLDAQDAAVCAGLRIEANFF